jgi:hypothetical protein
VVTTHTKISDKVRVWMRGEDPEPITTADLNRLKREPALVMSEGEDIVMFSDSRRRMARLP